MIICYRWLRVITVYNSSLVVITMPHYNYLQMQISLYSYVLHSGQRPFVHSIMCWSWGQSVSASWCYMITYQLLTFDHFHHWHYHNMLTLYSRWEGGALDAHWRSIRWKCLYLSRVQTFIKWSRSKLLNKQNNQFLFKIAIKNCWDQLKWKRVNIVDDVISILNSNWILCFSIRYRT